MKYKTCQQIADFKPHNVTLTWKDEKIRIKKNHFFLKKEIIYREQDR